MMLIKNKRIMALMLFIIILILPVFHSFSEEAVENNIQTRLKFYINEYRGKGYNYSQKNISMDASSYFFIRRIDYTEYNENYYTSFYIPGNEGTLRWYNEKNELMQKPLSDGSLPSDCTLFIDTHKYHMILSQAYNYKDLGDGTVEYAKGYTNPIWVTEEEGKWLVKYVFTKKEGLHGVMWGAGSQDKLINFDNETIRYLWSSYDINKNARFCEDGYYYKSPSSYTPSTPDSFWRIPSMFVVNSFVEIGGSLADDLMANAMLTIASLNINDEGYLPSLPKSGWLMDEYGIGPGFFDTRFNADTIETYIKAYQKFGQKTYRDAYLKLADYYSNHIENRHYTPVENSNGWLVQDYNHAECSADNHVALNHQLQSIHIMLMLYGQEQDNRYYQLALNMLQGIKDTRDLWVMDNNNLEYAYLPDGTMGYTDYPYLTYNDLFTVQKDLEVYFGERDEDLDFLMQKKKTWMDINGIKDYYK